MPTFTERYYSDPVNLARSEVGPEHAWAGEVGTDLFIGSGWVVQGTFFGRADSDVIDWLRPTTAERWRTYNVRDVDTVGVELGVRRSFGRGRFRGWAIHGTRCRRAQRDAALEVLARLRVAIGGCGRVAPAAVGLPCGATSGVSATKPANEPRGVFLLDVRVAKRLGSLVELRVDGMNLFDQTYHEIAGVVMPGAAVLVGASIGGGR